jgi:hypothetical protein
MRFFVSSCVICDSDSNVYIYSSLVFGDLIRILGYSPIKGPQTWHINPVFYIMCPQSNSKEDKRNHTMSKDSIDGTSTTTTTKMNKMSRIKILAHLV